MHYVAIINGKERDVEINEVSPDQFRVEFDGKVLDLDAKAVSDSTLSLVAEEASYNIESEVAADGSQNLLIRGSLLSVEVLDLRTHRLRKAQESAGGIDGPVVIRAPMPGKIVAVLVKEGDEVEEGQGVVVVEAMKMENELKAPKAGVITALTAEEGTPVEGGATLCTIE